MQTRPGINGRELSTALLACLIWMAAGMPAQSQTFTVLYRFKGNTTDGQNPEGPLFMDKAGNLYGTTVMGPACKPTPCHAGQGVVYQFNPSGTESLLHTFAIPAAGLNPFGGLIKDASRNAYGTTSVGGASNLGTVFRLNSQGETVLHSFTGADGSLPYAGVIEDANANLYGTTSAGGASDTGVLFKISGGTETVLHSFTGGPDGAYPYAPLLLNPKGNLFGTASAGGTTAGNCFPYGCGVVFTIDSSNKLTVLHTFRGSPDGSNPYAGLITDSAGNLYGTTYNGGTGPCTNGCGVVFKIAKDGTETVLYNFRGYPNDGAFPYGGLVRDTAGNLYGTTAYGGSTDNGVVFKLNTNNDETVPYNFHGTTDGATPRGGLILDASGNLYGTTYGGGISGVSCGGSPQDSCGVIFKITP